MASAVLIPLGYITMPIGCQAGLCIRHLVPGPGQHLRRWPDVRRSSRRWRADWTLSPMALTSIQLFAHLFGVIQGFALCFGGLVQSGVPVDIHTPACVAYVPFQTVRIANPCIHTRLRFAAVRGARQAAETAS